MKKPANTRIPEPVLAGAVFCATAFPTSIAEAYVGPGAGLSAIGIVFALIATVALAIVGFVWYPVKRLLKKRSGSKDASPQDATARPPHHSESSRSS